MEWTAKLINVLKIPLKILLPALWLFSGALTFLNGKILEKLSLFEWKTENGFIFGLIFAITSCLIIVYFLFHLKERLSNLIFKLTLKRKTMKRLLEMNDVEIAVILKLYNSPGYSYTLDYNEPIIKGLLARGLIYTGAEQMVTTSVFSNAIPMRFTLQPFVYQALNHYKPKLEKEIHKLQAKANEEKDATKKAKLVEQLGNTKENFYEIYNNGGTR